MADHLRPLRPHGLATCAAIFLAATVPDARAADIEYHLVHQDRSRSYVLHIPDARPKDSTLRPLVMVLHGGGGNAGNAARMTGMSAVADREGFLVVYPNGSGRLRNALLTWNAGNCCGMALNEQVDDVGFLNKVVDDVATRHAIDSKRVYLTGMSNGGMMTYRMGCSAPSRFAAIAPVAGAMNVRCTPSAPLSVIAFHGTTDEHVRYQGGAPVRNRDSHPRVDTAVAEAMAFWSSFNACRTHTQTQAAEVRTQTWENCAHGTTVQLHTLEGFGHAWPGGEKGSRFGDDPAASIQASEVMWKFFSAHPR